ncbi:hypothetical protein SORBI_3001G100900 [Sorghum bicolor]|uniref:Uncharacterized protein n=1 Tax=Sorghum bicolor TaxID=4558 RepID=A0A1B6QI88_SORBI|nr:hypothetical protein SORBI_3001G100900 [Sorghum bicolor]
MVANKRSGGAISRSLNENKRTCSAREATKSSLSDGLWDSKDGVWSKLSEQVALNLSKSVVSLVLSDGDTVLFASSGIAIECHGHVSRFLTSAGLVRALNNEENGHDNVKIEVHHKGRAVTGFLEEYDLDYDIAVVKITSFLDVQKVLLHRALRAMLHSEVVAVGHDISGKIMAKSGKLTCDPRGYEDCELMFSTCKLSEGWEGGPLFDFFGNFLGMNLLSSMGGSFFMPKDIIMERLEYFRTSLQRNAFLGWTKYLKAVIGLADDILEGDLLDSKQGVWGKLSEQVTLNLSKSVVSLVLSDGHNVLFASSGIAIECNANVSRFLTSANLVRALNNEEKGHANVKIEVRHKGRAITGFLEEHNLDYDIAVVKIMSFLDAQNVPLHSAPPILPNSKVVAVGHDSSGKIMATDGKLTCGPSVCKYGESLMSSTCILSKVWEGGPLFDFSGSFVGMNLFSSTEGSFFMPSNIIIEWLGQLRISQERNAFLSRVKYLKMVRVGGHTNDIPEAYRDALTDQEYEVHKMLGYPRPSKRDMILVNSFETAFGDVYDKDDRQGVWKLLEKRVSKGISRNVVSLASFNGNTRFFACTGFFIDWDDKCQDNNVSTILTSASLVRNSDPFDGENKVIDGLKIEVKHPKGPLLEGSLIHYNLDYNVALVSVKRLKSYSACPLAICKRNLIYESSKVVSVGCCFQTGKLMASGGKLVAWSGSLDCKLLIYSTCEITKAGIGGPLVDFDGNFIGMNFYDPKLGTPAVSCDDIVDVLERFKEKWTGGVDSLSNPNGVGGVQGDCSVSLNWWPVPRPYWRQPDEPEKSYLDEYERGVLDSGSKFEYVGGYIYILK